MVKAYTIVLRGHQLSEQIATEAIEAAKNYNIDLQIHDAVVGFESRPLFEQYNITKFFNLYFMEMAGHQGCFLSHFQLWQRCIELNEPIIITEHDAIFIRKLPEDVMDHFTDVLRLDAFQAWKPGYNDLVQASIEQPIQYERPEPHWHSHGSGGYCVGAYAYIIKPHAAQKLVDHAINNGANATEIHIGMDVVDITAVTASVARLHDLYVDTGLTHSTTNDLTIFKKGCSILDISQYVPPSAYR